jgi:Zn-dependent metalloprotease
LEDNRMTSCAHFHPIFCIVPPYILNEISTRGTPEQRDYAQKTLAITSTLRGQRELATRMGVNVTKGLGGRSRTVYTANNGMTLPGMKMRSEGEPPVSDVAVNEAYDGAGATYDLYNEVYLRDSVDGNGMRLDSTVHYQRSYDNAFWNGEQMVYGDGDEDLPEDQRLFNRFTISIDVIGHELTHGVTQFTANLIYANQPGALNESISDVFGALVKQRALGQTAAQADWLIGEGLLAARVKGKALRSMKEPGSAYDDPVLGKDPQPAHMRNYVTTVSDNGGVHINSGIPNKAFCVTALNIGGNAWDKAGKIWYVTLRNKVRATTNFQEVANMTVVSAGELFGNNSVEQKAVRAGWAEVGIAAEAVPGPEPQQPSGCLNAPLSIFNAVKRRFTGR